MSVILRRYNALLVCREMLRFVGGTLERTRDSQGTAELPNGTPGGQDSGVWSLFGGQRLTAIIAVFDSLSDMLTEEIDHLQEVISLRNPLPEAPDAKKPNGDSSTP